jgi:hypothetical protein
VVSVVSKFTGGSAWVGPATAVLLAVVFALNLGPFLRYRRTVEGWQTQTRVLVTEASAQLSRGCPDGRPAPAYAEPLGWYNTPWLTVHLLEQLETRASLHLVLRAQHGVSAQVRRATCSNVIPAVLP